MTTKMNLLVGALIILALYAISLSILSFLAVRSSYFKKLQTDVNEILKFEYKSAFDNFIQLFKVLFSLAGIVYLLGLIISPTMFLFDYLPFKEHMNNFLSVWAFFLIQLLITPFSLIFLRNMSSYILLWNEFTEVKKEKGIFHSIPQLLYAYIGMFWVNSVIALFLCIIIVIIIQG